MEELTGNGNLLARSSGPPQLFPAPDTHLSPFCTAGSLDPRFVLTHRPEFNSFTIVKEFEHSPE